jgi:hypothetical protein
MGNGPHDLLAGICRPILERFRAAAKDPAGAQRARLAELLAANARSEYGRRFGFDSIRTPAEYRERVPAIDFDAIAPEVERLGHGENGILTEEPVLRFVKTSGTTGASKRIPVTASLAREVRDAQLVWLVNLLRESPKHADGAKLLLVSPGDGATTPGGLAVGANTGRMQDAMPWFVRFDTVPHAKINALKDPEVRAFLVALAAAGKDVGTITTANPSTVWMLSKRLRAWAEPLADALSKGGIPDVTPDGTRIPSGVVYVLSKLFPARPMRANAMRDAARRDALFPALWPKLTTVNCWRGGPAAFYLEKLAPELAGIPVRDVGISASEGFFAVPLESGTASGVLLAGGPYFELEPAGGGEPVGVEGLEEGREYELRISTCGGLWRYSMRDVVRVTGRWENAPLIEFVRKSGSILSITGEKVTEPQVLSAAMRAANGTPLAGAGAMIEKADPPRYVALVEPEPGTTLADGFAAAFDAALIAANVEYAGKRSDGRLAPATLRLLPPGSFEAKRRERVAKGGPETQVKTPVLFPEGF